MLRTTIVVSSLFLFALALSSCGCGSDSGMLGSSPSGIAFLFTVDEDFDQGAMLNVNHDSPYTDQLQLNTFTEPFPFINVAASSRGTIVRINTDTGEVVGEYRSAPEGRGLNPSRTTVDLFGNVWTGNRGEWDYIGDVPHGSVVKIGLVVGGTRGDKNPDGSFTPNPTGMYLQPPFQYSTAVDRDGDGLIFTSMGLGDIRDWPDNTDGVGGTDKADGDARVEDALDECILIYQRTFDADQVRHVSVTADNNVWVGGYPFSQQTFHLLDGTTGASLQSFDADEFNAGGYGGLIDGNNVLWSASISQAHLLRYDIAAGTGMAIDVGQSYGLGIDTNGYIWNSMFTYNTIMKIAPDGTIVPGFPKSTGGASGDRGVAITPSDNHVWVANSSGSDVSRLDNDGNILKVISVGSAPTGVAVDSNGKVWVTNLNSDNVMRIDPTAGTDGLGEVDLTVPLGDRAGPYNYSDMTGAVAIGATSPQGTWIVVLDGGVPGMPWSQIRWNEEPEAFEPAGSSIEVEVRAADDVLGLVLEPWTAATNGGPLGLTGQFVEIRVTLKPASDGTSPVLSDLTIESAP
ncbi:MAG: hypothetical protein QNJ98_01915 [Planctomycetota bacterium]|nr:hypothetical protein [Planctomycetota bacterium]